MIKLDWNILCVNYQRRLCWVLSSIVQQIGNTPDICINISTIKNNGNPSTEEIVNYYSKYLKINMMVYHNVTEVMSRGNVRNKQMAGSDSEWFFFSDCDHVYPRNFFPILKVALENEPIKSYRCCLFSPHRETTSVPETEELVKIPVLYIDNAYEKAKAIPTIQLPFRLVAGGSMQLFHRDTLGGYYSKEGMKRDFGRINYHSDLEVRRRIGVTAEIIDLPPMIHLNHYRLRHTKKDSFQQ